MKTTKESKFYGKERRIELLAGLIKRDLRFIKLNAGNKKSIAALHRKCRESAVVLWRLALQLENK